MKDIKPIIYGATSDKFFKDYEDDGRWMGERLGVCQNIHNFFLDATKKDYPIIIEYRHSHTKGYPLLEKMIEDGKANVVIMADPTFFSYSKQKAFEIYRKCILSGVEIIFINTADNIPNPIAIYSNKSAFKSALNRIPRKYSTCDLDFHPLELEIDIKNTTKAPEDFFEFSMENTRSLTPFQVNAYWRIETGKSTEKAELDMFAKNPIFEKISKNTFRKRIAVYEASDKYLDDLANQIFVKGVDLENMPKAFGDIPANVIDAYDNYIAKGLEVPRELTGLPNPIDYKRYLLKYQRRLKNAKIVAIQKKRYHKNKNNP